MALSTALLVGESAHHRRETLCGRRGTSHFITIDASSMSVLILSCFDTRTSHILCIMKGTCKAVRGCHPWPRCKRKRGREEPGVVVLAASSLTLLDGLGEARNSPVSSVSLSDDHEHPPRVRLYGLALTRISFETIGNFLVGKCVAACDDT